MRPKAIITTKWDGTHYTPRTISAVESYFVDAALDTDADQFSLEIGDPDGDHSRLFERDNEVRVQLFGVGDTTKYLFTGIADDISLGDEGVIRITGRDMSSIAVDSTHPPKLYKHVKMDALIEQEARAIGMKGPFALKHAGIWKKLYRTDGSESYWEFWYRAVRKDQLWLWCDPAGMLSMNTLNYAADPKYFIGTPPKTSSAAQRKLYLPTTTAELHKTTTGRIAESWVFFHRGNWGDLTIAKDPSINGWLRRPVKIFLDVAARTGAAASKVGLEEIFEGKVGSIEHVITIPITNTPIRQNEIAYVNIPQRGLSGEFFVVGVRYVGDNSGFMQQIRLREKQYALTRRIPPDPKVPGVAEPQDPVAGGIPAQLPNIPWIEYFVAAARKHHGPWDFTLFLACLIGICDQETGFRNIRANGGPGGDGIVWYPRPTADPQDASRHGETRDQGVRTLEQWKTIFANEPGRYVNGVFAVGPMQLYSIEYKHFADDLFKRNFRDQFSGGRWSPEHNIMAGAFALRDKLKLAVRDIGDDNSIWAGVSYYGHHYADETPTTVPTRYAREVKYKVMTDPGYLVQVADAIKAARDAQNDNTRTDSNPYGTGPSRPGEDRVVPYGLPNRAQVLKNFKQLKNSSSMEDKYRALVSAAMWGHYNRDQIGYTQSVARDDDFGPPPNVPGNTDCSAFVTWCYMSAKLPDPSAQNYSPIGYTGSLVKQGIPVPQKKLAPGDLIFYGGTLSLPTHVGIYVGGGMIVDHGSEVGPLLRPANHRSDIVAIRRYNT